MAHKRIGKPAPTFTWDEIDAIRNSEGMSFPDCPPHAFTVKQYSEKFGVPLNTSSGQLLKLAKAGKLKAGRRQGLTSSGRRIFEVCYWAEK